jgi:hypothetical protein
MFGECEPCLSDASVRHFFQMLPSMKRLKGLVFPFSVPGLLTRAVVDGIKNNYSLHRVVKLKFGSAQLQSEIKSYTTANAKGREAVYDAVANHGNRPLLERALRVLHRLSKSDNEEDATTLYLCLQLYLPFAAATRGLLGSRCCDARPIVL